MTEAATDTATFASMRHAMVASQLRTTAVSDARVVAAMARIPREDFLPPAVRRQAYADRPVPLAPGRALNPPEATGRLLTEAAIRPEDRVLLIGAGCGYAAAVVSVLAGAVVAVEEAPLAEMARAALEGYARAEVIEGALAAGSPDRAPFDVLIVDGAVEELPEALVAQVRPGGRVVTGIVDRGVTRLAYGVRSEGGFGLADFADIGCVVLPGFARPRGFSF